MTKQDLADRKQKILQAVIHHYIRTAKPVGSETVIEHYRFDLSPATVRNILSSLEKEGYLTHLHTSGGRVPTDKGYRLYVDKLMQMQHLTRDEERRIEKEYELQRLEIDRIMQETSKMLSMLSHYTGFVLSPSSVEDTLARIELIKIGTAKVLAVIVTEAGLVRHRIVPLAEEITEGELRELNRSLNKSMVGVSVKNIDLEIIRRVHQERDRQQKYLQIMESILSQAFRSINEGEIYLEGASHILEQPDFVNYEKMRNVIKMIDEKKMFFDIIGNTIGLQGVHVVIGQENAYKDLQECSIVTSTYKAGDKTIGALGIIGPRRMEYSRMVALVDYFSHLINRILNKTERGIPRESGKKRQP